MTSDNSNRSHLGVSHVDINSASPALQRADVIIMLTTTPADERKHAVLRQGLPQASAHKVVFPKNRVSYVPSQDK